MKGGKRNDIDLGQNSLFLLPFFLCLLEEFLPINLSHFYPNLASISKSTWSGTLQFVTQSYLILQHHGLQHARLTCPSPTPVACSKSCPLSWWRHPTISSSVIPFSSCLQFFPASGSLQMSQLFLSLECIISQCIGPSTSVLAMNIQEWFPLGWTGWISLQSKGLSRVFQSSKASILWFLPFLIVQLSHPYVTTGKTIALTR